MKNWRKATIDENETLGDAMPNCLQTLAEYLWLLIHVIF